MLLVFDRCQVGTLKRRAGLINGPSVKLVDRGLQMAAESGKGPILQGRGGRLGVREAQRPTALL